MRSPAHEMGGSRSPRVFATDVSVARIRGLEICSCCNLGLMPRGFMLAPAPPANASQIFNSLNEEKDLRIKPRRDRSQFLLVVTHSQ
jgi:hypothetical protein